jgi:tRNA threonylcarbamoyladenosine biosynthesis protein TsaB
MDILFIDSATEAFSTALISGSAIAGEFFFQRPRGQLKHLLPSVLRVLDTCGIPAKSVDALAVTCGPGSFTGVRLGIITARTIAQILEKPVICLNTLDVIAMNITSRGIMAGALLDARRGEIFAAFYRNRENGQEKVLDYGAYKPEDFIACLHGIEGPVVLTGNGLARYQEIISSELGPRVEFLRAPYWYPRAAGAIPLIENAFRQGSLRKYYELQAFYMRETDAEESLKRKASGDK